MILFTIFLKQIVHHGPLHTTCKCRIFLHFLIPKPTPFLTMSTFPTTFATAWCSTCLFPSSVTVYPMPLPAIPIIAILPSCCSLLSCGLTLSWLDLVTLPFSKFSLLFLRTFPLYLSQFLPFLWLSIASFNVFLLTQ